jgi:hypothetical protein
MLHKFDKSLFQPAKVMPVGIHMIRINIRYDRVSTGCKYKNEASDSSASTTNKFTTSQFGMAACCFQFATDNESRIHIRRRKYTGYQASCGCFSMRACYRDATAESSNSASIKARGTTGIFLFLAAMTSGLSGFTAVEVTTTSAPAICWLA